MKDVGGCEKPGGDADQSLIPGCPNGKPARGNARVPMPEYIGHEEASRGTETSKYPEERKETSTP